MGVFYHVIQLPLFTSSKVCTACKKESSLESFTRDKRRKDGYNIYCRTCTRAKEQVRYNASREHILARQRASTRKRKPKEKRPHTRRLVPPAQNGRQVCTKCRIEKPLEDFYKDTRYLSGHKPACKKCIHATKIAHSRPDQCPISKICARCKTEKSIDQFYRNPTAKDGRSSYCNICVDTVTKRKNIGKLRERRGKVVAPGYKWCHGCRSEKPLEDFPGDTSKKDGHHPRCKACAYPAHREYRKANPTIIYNERTRIRGNAWVKAHPLWRLEKGRRREARKRAATIGKVSYKRILERDGFLCHICGQAVTRDQLSFDHVIPLARGGAHSEDNIKIAHKKCNFRKGAKLMEELAIG